MPRKPKSKTEQAIEIIEVLDLRRRRNKLRNEYASVIPGDEFAAMCAEALATGRSISSGGRVYPWQAAFHNASAEFNNRSILAANQTGKTMSHGAEVAIHATGLYPPWWEGRTYDEPVKICVCSETNETLRDPQQLSLYGGYMPETTDPDGTGWIPFDKIIDCSVRQCGVKGVYDEVRVRHSSGGISTIKHKTYEQGWTKFQGTQFDLYWLDEEPLDGKIFPEILRGTIVKSGMIIFSRTPTFGATDLVLYFMDGSTKSWFKNVAWSEAPHLSAHDKDRMLEGIPDYERECRSKGIPMLGSGVVYPVPDEEIMCDPFRIPEHLARICGIDFGIDHPTACCWLAHDRDADVVYVYDEYQRRGEAVPYHAAAIVDRGAWIPCSWPHDGLAKDKGTAQPLRDQYAARGVNMIHHSARWKADSGGGQSKNAASEQVLDRMRTGRFKVFSNCRTWFEQKRMYHRKDGIIVAVKDDVLRAGDYALMMIRYAVPSVMPRRPLQSEQYSPMEAYA